MVCPYVHPFKKIFFLIFSTKLYCVLLCFCTHFVWLVIFSCLSHYYISLSLFLSFSPSPFSNLLQSKFFSHFTVVFSRLVFAQWEEGLVEKNLKWGVSCTGMNDFYENFAKQHCIFSFKNATINFCFIYSKKIQF